MTRPGSRCTSSRPARSGNIREAWKAAGHTREPRVSVSRSIFALMDDRDRAYFGRDSESEDTIGFLGDNRRAVFGRSYAAEPDVLVEQLKKDDSHRRSRHAAAHGAQPARRRLQRPRHRGDPQARRPCDGVAVMRRTQVAGHRPRYRTFRETRPWSPHSDEDLSASLKTSSTRRGTGTIPKAWRSRLPTMRSSSPSTAPGPRRATAFAI